MSDFAFEIEHPAAGTVRLQLSGQWRLARGLPDAGPAERALDAGSIARLEFADAGLESWDSALVAFLLRLVRSARRAGIEVDAGGLPDGARRLLELAEGGREVRDAPPGAGASPLLARIGERALHELRGAGEFLQFVGESLQAFARMARGKPAFKKADLWLAVQQAGAEALPIATVIALLIGLILAFVGAVQLRWFGAEIYVADLVGIAMMREMAPIMTGIVLAGRTGAAYAANIGTMQGNEEIDALRTMGISPIDFLVLPRLLAMLVMMPLLVLYADAVGMFGGWVVSVSMLDLTSAAYIQETLRGVRIDHLWIGLVKSLLFGLIVASAGCMRGLQAGRSAAAVGDAATSAVVTGIVYIIVIDAIFAVLCNILGI